MKQRNHIPIHTHITVGRMSMMMCNFSLHEFEMHEGTVMVHPSVLVSLEQTRYDLCERYCEEVEIIITGSARTPKRNTEVGGVKNSRHLVKFGGIAEDCYARIKRTKKRIPQSVLGEIARRHWDYVKDDYADGHVHMDNRNQKP